MKEKKMQRKMLIPNHLLQVPKRVTTLIIQDLVGISTKKPVNIYSFVE